MRKLAILPVVCVLVLLLGGAGALWYWQTGGFSSGGTDEPEEWTMMTTPFAAWRPFYENAKYEGFFDSEIVEMELQISTVHGVTFSDADLLKEWEAYFRTLEIKKDFRESPFDEMSIGGERFVTVKTARGTYTFGFYPSPREDAVRLMIGDTYYAFRGEMDALFEETYALAAERHGEVNLWEVNKRGNNDAGSSN